MAAPRTAVQTTNGLKDRLQELIDNLLLRFKNIIELASQPTKIATKEQGGAQAYQMNVETTALVRSAEDLLKLTREMKEMWLFGKLRELGDLEADLENAMSADVTKVMESVQSLLEHPPRLREKIVRSEAVEAGNA